MDTSPHARSERTVKTVDFTRQTCSKEAENGSWPPFFGIRNASSSPTVWRREGQSRDSTLLIYWADSRLRPIWWRKNCSFTMITHQVTHPQWPQQNWSNYTTNCCLIHQILQIWPNAILFCSKTCKNSLVETDSRQKRKSLPQQRPILRRSTKKLENRWTKCIQLNGDYIEK